jgi:hypothetical protein
VLYQLSYTHHVATDFSAANVSHSIQGSSDGLIWCVLGRYLFSL